MKEQMNILTNGAGYSSDQYLFIHSTANPGATARNHLDHWRNNLLPKKNFSMTRYVTDWNRIVYQIAPYNTLLWEVGGGNSRGFGIEMCEGTNEAQFQACWDTTVTWAATILKRRGLSLDRMISHNQARIWWGGTTHTDPIPYFTRFGRTWEQFVAAVRSQMTAAPPRPPKQEPGNRINSYGLTYRLHVAHLGWLDWVFDGQWAGTRGFALRAEAIEVDCSQLAVPGELILGCTPHVAQKGWLPSQEMGKGVIIGTTGEARQAEALAPYVIKNTTGLIPYFQVHMASVGDSVIRMITDDIPLAVAFMLGSTGIGRQFEAARFWLDKVA